MDRDALKKHPKKENELDNIAHERLGDYTVGWKTLNMLEKFLPRNVFGRILLSGSKELNSEGSLRLPVSSLRILGC